MNDMSKVEAALFSVEAEQQILGAVLIDNGAYHRVSEILQADHFSDPVHARIWQMMGQRITDGGSVSPVIMRTMMGADPALEGLGGPAYFARMAAAAISSVAAPEYARMIVEMWQRRVVIEAMDAAREKIAAGADAGEAMSVLGVVTEAMRAGSSRPSTMSYKQALLAAMEATETAYHGGEIGIRTGIEELDEAALIRNGDMVVLGGAPSMGKTAIALSLAHKVADAGKGVIIASLEMTAESLAFRALGEVGSVAYSSLMRGKQSEDEFRRVVEGAPAIMEREIQIVQPHIKDLHSIHAAIVRARHQMEAKGIPLGMVLIDYLQLVRAPGKSPYERVSAVSSGIKSMAMQLDVPIVALAQLSREMRRREDNRPQLADLRDSGQIEQDADLIMFAHRESYYLEREPAPPSSGNREKDIGALADREATLAAVRNKVEIIVDKQRNGARASVMLGFDLATNRIWSLRQQRDDRQGDIPF